MVVLSHYQARPLLQARQAGEASTCASPDLNLSRVEVTLDGAGVCFPTGERVTWVQLEEIAAAENSCFVLREGDIHEVRAFSEVTNWLRALYPTGGAPTMLVSGVLMHRVKDTDPYKDTLKKIKAARPSGDVLDTATGLGYTAIEAARVADHVVTVEIDPAALEVARLNPWSKDLFANPGIEQVIGDVYDVVEEFDDGRFSCVIHDPPTFSLAGDLYSRDFYAELYRVLREKGRLFHYVGDPESKSGRGVTRGVVRRLGEVGFTRVVRRPEAFGLVAYK
jgi:predicted methyltransferase